MKKKLHNMEEKYTGKRDQSILPVYEPIIQDSMYKKQDTMGAVTFAIGALVMIFSAVAVRNGYVLGIFVALVGFCIMQYAKSLI